jgi:hypothetical protein
LGRGHGFAGDDILAFAQRIGGYGGARAVCRSGDDLEGPDELAVFYPEGFAGLAFIFLLRRVSGRRIVGRRAGGAGVGGDFG